MALQITDANYKELLASDKLVVIDFLGGMVRARSQYRPSR